MENFFKNALFVLFILAVFAIVVGVNYSIEYNLCTAMGGTDDACFWYAIAGGW